MKIAIAQTKPVKGDIESNILNHERFILKAAELGANAIVFPELSLTGYEPRMAYQLAATAGDGRFSIFDELSVRHRIHVAVGMPLRGAGGIIIAMVIFSGGERQVYTKEYLHEDELPFFINGKNEMLPFEAENKLSLAICYELSMEQHSEKAFRRGSHLYVAGVAKTQAGVESAAAQLSVIAKKYSMVVIMSNCVGTCDDFMCGG